MTGPEQDTAQPGGSTVSATSANNLAADVESTSPRFLSAIPNSLAFWLPIITSIVSLIVAVSSYVVATQEPDVLLVLPKEIRLAQGGDAARLYVQPKFISTGRNDRLEIVLDMKIRAERLDGSDAADFAWTEQGSWNYDPSTQELTYIYVGDASPLMISPSNPQLPTGLFTGPPGWTFKAGEYRFTLTASRAIGSSPLQGSFEVSFSEDNINLVNSSKGNRFLKFPTGK